MPPDKWWLSLVVQMLLKSLAGVRFSRIACGINFLMIHAAKAGKDPHGSGKKFYDDADHTGL